jgi:ABC-2 type transport system permease protein
MTGVFKRARRAWMIGAAFLWMGKIEAFAYPLGLAMGFLSQAVAPVALYFIGELVGPSPSVGGDYFTFALIGLVAGVAMLGGLSAFGGQLDVTISTGRVENLLVEPIAWRLLPFCFAGWPIVVTLVAIVLQIVIGLLLGATFNAAGIPLAIVVLLGAIAAGHAIGVLSASVKVLSKRTDPIIALYTMASGLLSGATFPIELLPTPVRVLSYMLPQTYVISALRQLLMTDPDGIQGPNGPQAVGLLALFLIVVYPLAFWLFGRALEYARRIGTLAGY